MNYCKSILICGGDKRQKYMYRQMEDDGFKVHTYALGEDGSVNINDINKYDVVIFPVPVSLDGIYLNAPLIEYDIRIDDILSRLSESQIVLGGMCSKLNCNMIDYYQNEKLQMQNAVPTAEGAIRIAMENSDFTLNESKCLVLGYGRIGKVLSERLKHLGAEVTVSARKESDIALAQIMKLNALTINCVFDHICNYDIIFNTIPKTIVTSDILGNISKSTLMIDLASKPYGIDMTAAKALDRRVIIASGLPGKFTPKTSGKILKEVITEILVKMEV